MCFCQKIKTKAQKDKSTDEKICPYVLLSENKDKSTKGQKDKRPDEKICSYVLLS